MFCTPPPPPPLWVVGTTDMDWVARGLLSYGNGSIVASTLRWSSVLLSPSGGDRGGAGWLAEFLAGVRRTSIEAGRYKAGWTRLSAGGRKRRAAALAAGPPVLGVGGELGCGRRQRWPGTGQPRGGCPPVAFLRGGSLLVDRCVPIDDDGLDGACGL